MVCSPLMMRYGTIVKKMTVIIIIIIIIYKNKTVVTKIKDFFLLMDISVVCPAVSFGSYLLGHTTRVL